MSNQSTNRLTPQRFLVIYENQATPENERSTVLHHVRALETSDVNHHISYFNTAEVLPENWFVSTRPIDVPSELLAKEYDAVILHYTFLACRMLGKYYYRWRENFEWIRDLRGLKIAVPQDEGNFADLLDEWLNDLDVSVVFSVHYAPDGPLYPIMRRRATMHNCLPGYIDQEAMRRLDGELLPIAERPKDIVYRARRLSYGFGRAGLLKSMLADAVDRRARAAGLLTDISTRPEDTIHGKQWLRFLASGRAVLGAEGGYSCIDWRGELRAQCEELLRRDPSMTFEELDARMPHDWDCHCLFTITPRHFEAVMARSCQVLVEGNYKGVLTPDRHYIPLRRDFSNLDEVLEKLHDHAYLQKLADQSYHDIAQSQHYTYRAWAQMIEKAVAQCTQAHNDKETRMPDSNPPDAVAALERQLIAARHENARLQASLHEMAEEIASRSTDIIVPRVMSEFRKAAIRRIPHAILGAVLFLGLFYLIVKFA